MLVKFVEKLSCYALPNVDSRITHLQINATLGKERRSTLREKMDKLVERLPACILIKSNPVEYKNARDAAPISLFWAPNGLNELPEMCFEYPCKLIGKLTPGFCNRPIMARTQILVHREPRTRIISACAVSQADLLEVKFRPWRRLVEQLWHEKSLVCPVFQRIVAWNLDTEK